MIEVSLMFGGNLGDVPGAFACALRELESNGFQVHAQSSVFLTAPVDCVPGTPDFQNMAVLGFWQGSPRELLNLTQRIERESGRPAQHSSREARTLDIDIITFGQEILREDDLIIPHADMENRTFVLKPLCEIAPYYRHPVNGLTGRQMLEKLKYWN